jgi:hypothetical protein
MGGISMVWIVRSQDDTDELKGHVPMEYLDDGAEREAEMEREIIDQLLLRFRGNNHEPFSSPDWDFSLSPREDLTPSTSLPIRGYQFPQLDRPLKLRMTEPVGNRSLPDIVDSWLVPDEVRDIIEAIEPKTHVFWPVELYHNDGRPEVRRRWGLRYVGRRETIATEKSDVFVRLYGEGRTAYSVVTRKDMYKPERIKFWKDKVAGHAIWWEYKFDVSGAKMASDALVDSLRSAKITGFTFKNHEHFEEVAAEYSSPYQPTIIKPEMKKNG